MVPFLLTFKNFIIICVLLIILCRSIIVVIILDFPDLYHTRATRRDAPGKSSVPKNNCF
jgi:energy-converting hydrogenase Eha subunit A